MTLPESFCRRMQAMLGDEYDAFIKSYEQMPRRALRLNPLKFQNMSLSDALSSLPWEVSPIPWCDTGFYYNNEDRPGRHVLHEAGVYYIQEPSAMVPAALLDAKPGEYILDLCAAPGGKSTQIAGAMKGEGILVSNEIIPNRAAILSENIERCGITNAIVTNEDSGHLSQIFPEYFDAIMVDSPCSGEGMFRKDENAASEWSLDNVKICAERDDEILDNADRMLSPGGRMVYSTCTFAPAENEGSIARFLRRHPNYRIASPVYYEGLDKGIPSWGIPDAFIKEPFSDSAATAAAVQSESSIISDLASTIRIWPHHAEGEGHYAAILIKDGPLIPRELRHTANGGNKSIKNKDLELWIQFKEEILQLQEDTPLYNLIEHGTYLWFGDNLYVLDGNAPGLKNLKTKRPGLHLGTRKKQRFEPSHALALALFSEQVQHSADVNSIPSFSASRFIGGETFSREGEKGWYLITAGPFSIGWGKLAGGIMKNHYPKGLRKTY